MSAYWSSAYLLVLCTHFTKNLNLNRLHWNSFIFLSRSFFLWASRYFCRQRPKNFLKARLLPALVPNLSSRTSWVSLSYRLNQRVKYLDLQPRNAILEARFATCFKDFARLANYLKALNTLSIVCKFRDFLIFMTRFLNLPFASALALHAITTLFRTLPLNLRLNARSYRHSFFHTLNTVWR